MLNHFKWTGCFFCLCQVSSSAAGQGSRDTMFCTIRLTRVWPVSELQDTKNRMEFSDVCKRLLELACLAAEKSVCYSPCWTESYVFDHTHTKIQLQYQLIWNGTLGASPALLSLSAHSVGLWFSLLKQQPLFHSEWIVTRVPWVSQLLSHQTMAQQNVSARSTDNLLEMYEHHL